MATVGRPGPHSLLDFMMIFERICEIISTFYDPMMVFPFHVCFVQSPGKFLSVPSRAQFRQFICTCGVSVPATAECLLVIQELEHPYLICRAIFHSESSCSLDGSICITRDELGGKEHSVRYPGLHLQSSRDSFLKAAPSPNTSWWAQPRNSLWEPQSSRSLRASPI